VRRLLATASGDRFGWSLDQLRGATKADALNHPTWSMGAKITIDSSTLMNRDLRCSRPPRSSASPSPGRGRRCTRNRSWHSMVEYVDGWYSPTLAAPICASRSRTASGCRYASTWMGRDRFHPGLEFDVRSARSQGLSRARPRLRSLPARRSGARVVERRERGCRGGVLGRRHQLVRHHRRSSRE